MENNNFNIEVGGSYIIVPKSATRRTEYTKVNIKEITEHTILYTQEDGDILWRQGKTEFNTEYKVIERLHTGGIEFKGNLRPTESPFLGRNDLVKVEIPKGATVKLTGQYIDTIWLVTD